MPYINDPIVETVLGAAIEVHKELGPGLIESVYHRCLAEELASRDISFAEHQPIPVAYKGRSLGCGYRLDLLIEERLVVELKAVEQVLPVHGAQLLTYLKLLKIEYGLLINFNVPKLVDGVRSFVRRSG